MAGTVPAWSQNHFRVVWQFVVQFVGGLDLVFGAFNAGAFSSLQGRASAPSHACRRSRGFGFHRDTLADPVVEVLAVLFRQIQRVGLVDDDRLFHPFEVRTTFIFWRSP